MADEQAKVIIKTEFDSGNVNEGIDEIRKGLDGIKNTNLDKPFKNMKADIKAASDEAQKMAQKFGTNSQQFADAAKRVASLKDEFSDFNKTIQAFNPDNKLQALVSIGRAGVGAVQGVAGAMTLLGAESENTQKVIAKLQALMALSDALNSVDDMKNAYKNLSGVIQSTTVFQKANNAATSVASTVMKAFGVAANTTSVGFKVLKVAIASTGIGLLVVALGSLVANFDSVKKAVLNLIPGLGKVADFIGGIINAVTDFVGATSEAERASERLVKKLGQQITDQNRFLDLNGDKYDEYTNRKIKANIDYLTKQKEFLEDEKLTESQRTQLINQAAEQRNREIGRAETDRQTKIKETNDKIIEDEKKKNEALDAKRKAANDKVKAENERIAQEKKNALAELKKIEEESIANIAKSRLDDKGKELFDLDAAFNEKKDKFVKHGQDISKITEEYNINRAGIEKKYADEIAEIQKGNLIKEAGYNTTNKETTLITVQSENEIEETDPIEIQREKFQAIWDAERELRDAKLAEDLLVAEGDNAKKLQLQAQYNADVKNANQDLTAFNEELKKKEVDAENAKFSAMGKASEMFADLLGRHTVAGKALAIAGATISTFQGAANVLAEKSTLPAPFSTIMKIAQMATVIATGIKQVKAITAIKVPSKSGGGGGGASAPTVTAPTINSTMLNPDAMKVQDVRVTNNGEQAPIKAYITNRDLQANEDKKKFLNNLSGF